MSEPFLIGIVLCGVLRVKHLNVQLNLYKDHFI